jgi:type 1 glutamine amidotransferase/HEAT repeat protein
MSERSFEASEAGARSGIPRWSGNALVRYCIIALLAGTAFAAPVHESIKETVKKIQVTNGFEPRDLFFTMEIALPKMINDPEQCKEMAQLLRASIAAPETTAPAKTILHQYLIKIDVQAEAKPLGEAFASGACAKKSADECLKLLASADGAERLAGLVAYATGYPKEAVNVCADAVKDASWPVRATAIRCLGRLDSKALSKLLPGLDGADRKIALDVVEEHAIQDACSTVREWAKAGDEQAIRALSAIGSAADVETLAQVTGGEKAIAQMTQKGVDAKITELLKTVPRAEARVVLLNASALRNSSALSEQLGVAANDADQTVRQATFRLLGRTADAAAFPLLVSKLGGPDTEAVENATRLMVRRLGEDNKFLEPLLKRMKDAEAVQDAVLKVLSVFTDDAALAAVVQALPRDAAVRALCAWQSGNAGEALEKVKNDASMSATHRALAERAITRLGSSITRAKAIVYLDCGKEAKTAKGKDGVVLEQGNGTGWTFEDSVEGTVAFDGHELRFSVAGLKKGQKYKVYWSWWDYDSATRHQSVWAGKAQLLPSTPLPSHAQGKTAETLSAVIPEAAIEKGTVLLSFKKDGGANAVVSDLWITETDETAQPVTITRETKPVVAAQVPAVLTAPEVRANAGAPKKILILTGMEHHNNWKQLTPILVEAFASDKRLEVSVSEQPAIMTKEEVLAKYDGYVMLYNNSDKKPSPEGALANLKKAVEGGKGLVLVHFSSGAFYDWTTKKVDPAFCEIAGRVWNPACRGHDPHGTFTVNIADKTHFITKGMSDYEQVDELYTCIEGPQPIQVLATGVSKVDKKVYPLAFVLNPGKGRTFHCALGHSPAAFNEPTKQLFRQGVLWAVKLD